MNALNPRDCLFCRTIEWLLVLSISLPIALLIGHCFVVLNERDVINRAEAEQRPMEGREAEHFSLILTPVERMTEQSAAAPAPKKRRPRPRPTPYDATEFMLGTTSSAVLTMPSPEPKSATPAMLVIFEGSSPDGDTVTIEPFDSRFDGECAKAAWRAYMVMSGHMAAADERDCVMDELRAACPKR